MRNMNKSSRNRIMRRLISVITVIALMLCTIGWDSGKTFARSVSISELSESSETMDAETAADTETPANDDTSTVADESTEVGTQENSEEATEAYTSANTEEATDSEIPEAVESSEDTEEHTEKEDQAQVTANEDDPTYVHDDNNVIIVKNSEFVAYSQNCQLYPAYHQNDKIIITSVDDQTNVSGTNFAGIGTMDYPFAGSLKMDSNTDITLNLDAPLFNYVYDTVTIENNGKPLSLSRYYYRGAGASETTPLIAVNVVPGSGTKAQWKVDVKKPTDSSGNYLKGFGGFIGRLCNVEGDAVSLSIVVTMNIDGEDTNAVTIKGDADTGLLCGVMEERTSLTADIKSDRGVGSITTSAGNVGGLVGTMGSGSTLVYSSGQLQASGTTITTLDGYAGGVVGYNQGGTVDMSGSLDPYTICQSIEGTSGAGSIYGYYQPVANSEVVYEFDITKYNITSDCQLKGSGNMGGLFGELETIGDVVIKGSTIDSKPSTVSSKLASGAADSFGGLVGRFSTDSLSHSLTIKDISVSCQRNGTANYYGGGIGVIEDDTVPSYVKFDNFVVDKATNAGESNKPFGGLVAKADRSFVEGSDIRIATDGKYRGGAAVGSLADGVLKLSGSFDISEATTETNNIEFYEEGKIVGYRNNGLVYADGWTYMTQR